MKFQSWYNPITAVALSIASGIILAFALPPHNLGILTWIALLPLLLASRISRPLISAGGGMLAAIACGWVLVGHVDNIGQYGNMIGAFGGLALALGFAAGFAAVGSKRVNPEVWPFYAACVGVAAEFLSQYVFPVNVAIAQYRNPGMLHLASYTGIWGVSFLIWFVPASLITLAHSPRSARLALLIAAPELAMALLAHFPIEHGRIIRAAAIQAQDPYNASDKTNELRGKVDIAVWPEQLLETTNKLPYYAAGENKVYVAANYYDNSASGKPYNTARLISPRGKLIATFQKQILFGRENYDLRKGKPRAPVHLPGMTPGVLICFDTEFPGPARDLARRGADFILVPNSDPEMPNSLFNYLHSAIITFRAAENGIPIAWAESKALSMIVDGSGKILTRAAPHVTGSAHAAVPLRTSTTLFTLLGNYFAYICIGVWVTAPFVFVMRRKPAKIKPGGNSND